MDGSNRPGIGGWNPALPCSGLLGAGLAVWVAGIGPWQAAVLGTIGAPAPDRWLGVGVAAACALVAARLQEARSALRLRLPLLVAGALAAASAVALAMVAAVAAGTVADGWTRWPLPLLTGTGAAALVATLAASSRPVATLAATLVGAGVGLGALAVAGQQGSGLQPVPAFAVLASAALLLMVAAAAMPTWRDLRSRFATRNRPVGAPVALPWAALPAVAAAFALARRSLATGTGTLAVAVVLALALGAVIAAVVPPRHRGRLLAVAVVATVVATPAGAAFAPLGGAAVLAALPVGALLALALPPAGPVPVPGRTVLAAAAGAGSALTAIGLDLGVDRAAAVAAALALVSALRRSALVPLALAAVAVVASVRLGWPEPPVAPDGTATLARATDFEALYRRSDQAMLLQCGGVEVDAVGPERSHAALLAGLAVLLADDGGGPVLIGSDCGRVRDELQRLGRAPALVVEPAPASEWLHAALRGMGPLASPGAVAPTGDGATWFGGSRQFARAVPAGSCRALILGAPMSVWTSTRGSLDEQLLLRRAAGRGLVLQAVRLDEAAPDLVAAALAAAAAAHPLATAFLCQRTLIVVGSADGPDLARAAARLEALPAAARWCLHAAGLGGVGDLAGARLGRLALDASATAGAIGDDGALRWHRRPAAAGDATLDANVAVLRRALGAALTPIGAARLAALAADPSGWSAGEATLQQARRRAPDSVLWWREQQAAACRAADRAIAAVDPTDPAAVAAAADLAARFCHLGSPSPALQAALALPDRRGERVRTPFAAGSAALALDPDFGRRAPPVLRPIVARLPARSPLADFGPLPKADELAGLAAGDGALAIALRRRFPSPCAAALVAAWGRGDASAAQRTALRELADPFVLAQAAAALAARGADGELLQIWRRDLPATAAVRALAGTAAPAVRTALQVAAAGRTDPDSLDLIGGGLTDADPGVRAAAGAALFRSIGDRIAYDPAWPADRLAAAAAQLAALNPRTP